jgi:hypothetical protein
LMSSRSWSAGCGNDRRALDASYINGVELFADGGQTHV